MDAQGPVYEALPENLRPEPQQTFNKDYIVNYVRRTVPLNDAANLGEQLKWNFLLEAYSLEKQKPVRKKRTFLTRRERKALGLLKLPKDNWNYDSLAPIRQLWQEYMKENLALLNGQDVPTCSDQEWTNFSNIVARSELIGAEFSVVRSKVPSQVGISGTVVLETKQTFQIVTEQSKFKVIPKATSVFEFRLDDLRFTVFGKHIVAKPGERSVKKIKSQMLPDL